MRLWHESLIPLLPRQQLLGQHRECCALRGNGWGKPHSTVNYVFNNPYECLVAYHEKVMEEMTRRGYKHDQLWDIPEYRGKSHKTEYCFDYTLYYELSVWKDTPIYSEHNDEYLQECLKNLDGKGIHINKELLSMNNVRIYKKRNTPL